MGEFSSCCYEAGKGKKVFHISYLPRLPFFEAKTIYAYALAWVAKNCFTPTKTVKNSALYGLKQEREREREMEKERERQSEE